MDITGVIKIEENDTYRYDNKEDNGVSLVMINSDEPLTMDEDENIYFENEYVVECLELAKVKEDEANDVSE